MSLHRLGLFVDCFSVFGGVQEYYFFKVVDRIDDSVVAYSQGPFVCEVSAERFSQCWVCFELSYC